VQLFIYIGGIAVLIVFAVMLTRRMMNPKEEPFNQQWWIAAIAAVALFAVLGLVLLGHEWDEAAGSVPDDSIQVLGRRLLEPQGFVLPFEVASVLLVAALVGAVTIARERR
jgi:NADH-quinone oxidoreductase subunit J